MSKILGSVDGLLIDIAGVLTHGNEVIPGARKTLASLRAQDVPIRFCTNTTIVCRETLYERMTNLGFELDVSHLYTSTYAAGQYLREQNAKTFFPLLLPDAIQEFTGIDIDEENPEFVVMGDMGASFNFARLNKAFRAVLNGAKLIALHKKRVWRTEEGLFMDAGPFVVAVEYATGQNALVVGKPSASFFQMVLEDLELPPKRVAMIGDDIEIDIRGAQSMGMKGWLVRTGRFRREDLARAIWPDHILDDFASVLN